MQVKLSAVQLFSWRKKKPPLSFKVKTKKNVLQIRVLSFRKKNIQGEIPADRMHLFL